MVPTEGDGAQSRQNPWGHLSFPLPHGPPRLAPMQPYQPHQSTDSTRTLPGTEAQIITVGVTFIRLHHYLNLVFPNSKMCIKITSLL